MSIRKWFMDFEINDKYVIVTVDITGIEPKDLWIGVSNTLNSLVLKHNNDTRDIPISVKVTENFDHFINNGVLTVTIERLTE